MQTPVPKWMHTKVWWEIAETEQSLFSDNWGLVENGKDASKLGMTLYQYSRNI